MVNRLQIVFMSAMRYGLYLGPLLVLINVVMYLFVDLSHFSFLGITALMVGLLFIPTVLAIYWLMKRLRDIDLGGVLSYSEGLRFGSTLMMFAGIVLAGYNMAMDKWIDPDYNDRVQEVVIEKTVEFYKESGYTQAEADAFAKDYEKQRAEAAKQPPLVSLLMSIPLTAFEGFLISLAVAAILKRKGEPYESAMKNSD